MPLPADILTLVADVGGTNTRLALARGGRVETGTVRRYANAGQPGLAEVIAAYLADQGGVDCAGACVAVAGPVDRGVGRLTNLDWQIDSETLARATGAERVAVLNDLQAQGHALGHIAPENLRRVIGGAPRADGARLVIGVGTGFNAAPVHGTGAGRLVAASECGHASLPVRTEADLRLLRFVETAHGFPGVEDVLSGRGLERLFAFTAREAGSSETRSAAAIMTGMGRDPLCEATGRAFVRLLGTVAGDLALIHLPYGGVSLVGGVARAFAPWLGAYGFAEAFADKGRFSDFMHGFSVDLVEDDFAALTGCALYLEGRG